MKDFIQRNMPVFVIGLVTIGVFFVIIITASKNPGSGPKLEQIKNEKMVTETTPTVGPLDSKVVLVEFSDFECPACKAFQPVVSSLIEKYKDRVLFVYKHMPLPQHTNARSAAIAAEAAHEQGKFWEYGERLFDVQPDFSTDKYLELALEIGLDRAQFERDLDSEILAKRVDEDRAQAIRIGVDSTPTFILNGQVLKMTAFEDLENAIKEELVKNNLTVSTVNEATQSTPTATVTKNETTAEMLAVDNKYGYINISYTEGGFNPLNVKAIQGQLVRWTNNTAEDMHLQQIIYLYPELNTPTLIKPGQTFEFRLTKDKLWTYRESEKSHYASIFTVAEQ